MTEREREREKERERERERERHPHTDTHKLYEIAQWTHLLHRNSGINQYYIVKYTRAATFLELSTHRATSVAAPARQPARSCLCVFVCVSVYVYIHTFMYMCRYIHIRIYIHICIYTHICIYIHIYNICIYVHVHECM